MTISIFVVNKNKNGKTLLKSKGIVEHNFTVSFCGYENVNKKRTGTRGMKRTRYTIILMPHPCL